MTGAYIEVAMITLSWMDGAPGGDQFDELSHDVLKLAFQYFTETGE
jgi:hypothetical protein